MNSAIECHFLMPKLANEELVRRSHTDNDFLMVVGLCYSNLFLF